MKLVFQGDGSAAGVAVPATLSTAEKVIGELSSIRLGFRKLLAALSSMSSALGPWGIYTVVVF